MRQVRLFLFLILMSFSIIIAAQTTVFPTVEYQTDKDVVISKVSIISTSTIVSVRVQGKGYGQRSARILICVLFMGPAIYQYPIRALSDGVKALSLGQIYYTNDYGYYTIDLIFDKIPLGCNVITVQEMDGWFWSGTHINNPG